LSTKKSGDPHFNTGDIAWMLMSTALVLIMTPGLAFFYGGMVNKKNVISTMLQSIVCMVIITVMWGIFGFSLAFGDSLRYNRQPINLFYDEGYAGQRHLETAAPTIPLLLFAMYQLKFAIITPALDHRRLCRADPFQLLHYIPLPVLDIYIFAAGTLPPGTRMAYWPSWVCWTLPVVPLYTCRPAGLRWHRQYI
jgi:hypothetical protein